MARITVETDKIRNMANDIREYVRIHRSGMSAIDSTFQNLKAHEIGEEFTLLWRKWEEAKGSGSISQEMLTMLERYADYLTHCAINYETAQQNAKIRSSWI